MKFVRYILLAMLPLAASGQNGNAPVAPSYPQDYFRNPLDIPIFLAGNFGECRPGHFHSGMDIKTLGRENQPVHAAADGYISRIKMEKGGFGHALYITHPNGYTTLYAHLNKFAPQIQAYLRKQQYLKKRWDVDLNLSPKDFPVRKGQQIAWSGNTGGSTAPHLHFEIRDTKTEHPLNAELFGLPLVDKMPPVPTEVVIYDYKCNSFYFSQKEKINLTKKSNIYVPAKIADGGNQFFSLTDDTVFIPAEGRVGIGINVNDYMDGSENTLAFYTAKLFMDDSLQAQITLDDIGYDESRYVNAYADYGTRQETKEWIQLFFKLPGNNLGIYSNLNKTAGWLNIPYRTPKTDPKTLLAMGPGIKATGQLAHKITIVITDDKGNESKISFYVVPAYFDTMADECMGTKEDVQFYAKRPNSFRNSQVAFSLDERQLYDDVVFRSFSKKKDNAYADEQHLLYPDVPVHHYFDLSVATNKPVPISLQSKIAMIYTDGRDTDGRAALAGNDGWYHAKVRNFGTYWLDVDTTAPVIHCQEKDGANLSRAERITFVVKDAQTSVRSFSGYLDGKWICFESHEDLYFYEFDEHCPKGKHELVFKAEDENGNAATYKLSFTR